MNPSQSATKVLKGTSGISKVSIPVALLSTIEVFAYPFPNNLYFLSPMIPLIILN